MQIQVSFNDTTHMDIDDVKSVEPHSGVVSIYRWDGTGLMIPFISISHIEFFEPDEE